MSALLRRSRREDGFALVSAVVILLITSLVTLAVIQTVNAQTHLTGHEVAAEAAFNLAESAVDAESLQLEQAWPGSAATAYPASCNQASTAVTGCPGTSFTSSYSSAYSGPSFSSPVWTLQIIDDTGGASYYSDTLASSPTTWDSNGDGRLWVRAQATIWGQKRIVVAQVVRQSNIVALPQNLITAGGVYTSNSGNKIIIEGKDPVSGLTGLVAVRCSASVVDYGTDCLGWNASHGQLDPGSNYQANYVDPNGGYATLSASQLYALKQTAIAAGTYFPAGTCPTAGLPGVVYVENANCVYQSNTVWNSDAAPGALIFASGTVTFNGTLNFYGIVYMANGQGSVPTSGPCTSAQLGSTPVFTVHGGGNMYGGVFVDKCGMVDAGDEKFDLNFDSAAFSGIRAIATPELAKNTFRIIPNG
jgi:type II secretory pathway pseudopilin PulG